MIQKGISLKGFNTFGFGIDAALFGRITHTEAIEAIWKTTLIPSSHLLILGGGSNVVFAGNYPGLILKNEIMGKSIIQETDQHVLLRIGGGENWHETVMWAVSNGWGGMENLSLIPGTVGAAPIQNIGAYGTELEQVFDHLEAFDLQEGKRVTFNHEQCRFGYRESIFKHKGKGRYFITHVILRLDKNPTVNVKYGDIQAVLDGLGIANPSIQDVSNAVIQIRRSKLPDPATLGNCGSFFKNPVIEIQHFTALQSQYPDIRSFPAAEGTVKVPAAWLIEKCGWKGFRRGDAGVHAKQALVLVNYGHASGPEIIGLAKEIQQSVWDTFQVRLEMEVNVR
jgi:UDP-N-acetylmuramate dehydrogenase